MVNALINLDLMWSMYTLIKVFYSFLACMVRCVVDIGTFLHQEEIVSILEVWTRIYGLVLVIDLKNIIIKQLSSFFKARLKLYGLIQHSVQGKYNLNNSNFRVFFDWPMRLLVHVTNKYQRDFCCYIIKITLFSKYKFCKCIWRHQIEKHDHHGYYWTIYLGKQLREIYNIQEIDHLKQQKYQQIEIQIPWSIQINSVNFNDYALYDYAIPFSYNAI